MLTPASAEYSELYATCQSFMIFQHHLNIYTDSEYIAQALSKLEAAFLQHKSGKPIGMLFLSLRTKICQRTNPFFVACGASWSTGLS